MNEYNIGQSNRKRTSIRIETEGIFSVENHHSNERVEIWRVDNGRCIGFQDQRRRTSRGWNGRERREEKGVENWWRVGCTVPTEGTREQRMAARKRPQESGGISARTGEKHPLDASWAGRWEEREDRGKTASERERDSEGWLRRGCKCPRDVSDRCGSTQTPPTRLLRDLKTFSSAREHGWITTVLFLSS